MGCGSSSTPVETFKNPDENRAKQTQSHSNPQPTPAQTRPKSKQSSKSSSRSSSASSINKHKGDDAERYGHNSAQHEHRSRNSSANTKRTYTIEHNQDGNVHGVHVIGEENDKIEVDPQENVFITRNKAEDDDVESLGEEDESDSVQDNTELSRGQNNQQEVETKKVSNLLDEDEMIILENGLCVLDIPEVDETRQMKDYTLDDLADDKNLFKYGRKVYSNDTMQAIIKERVRQYAEVATIPYMYGVVHPVHVARVSGVTRKEMKQLLPVCQVGHFKDLPQDEYLSRMKQGVENILESDEDSDLYYGQQYLYDYKEQLSRWLQKYPLLQTENKLDNYNTDPNEITFPVCIDDPLEFRKWSVEWETFDTDVPESGAWDMFEFTPIHDPSLASQHHEHYASVVKHLHEDDSLDDLDMTIDGEAAWNVIELDIVKNDQATDEQVKIWSLREKRSNLNDREWMEKRRRQIADAMLIRHRDRMEAVIMEPYLSFAEHMEDEWKLFQEACDKYFNPPHKYRILYTTSTDDSNFVSGADYKLDDDANQDQDYNVNNNTDIVEDSTQNNDDRHLNDDTSENSNHDETQTAKDDIVSQQSEELDEQFNDQRSSDINEQNVDKINPESTTDGDEHVGLESSDDPTTEHDQTSTANGWQESDYDPIEQQNNVDEQAQSNDERSTGEGGGDRGQVQNSTPVSPNGQRNDGRPQIETMDSGLELDTSDTFYK